MTEISTWYQHQITISSNPLTVSDTGMAKVVIRLVEMAWAAKRPADEPLTGVFTDPLAAQFYLLFLTRPLTSCYQFSEPFKVSL